MKKVLIPTKLDGIASKILTENGNYTVVQDSQSTIEEVVAANPDAYALIVRSEVVSAELIDRLPHLKVIVRAGAGPVLSIFLGCLLILLYCALLYLYLRRTGAKA